MAEWCLDTSRITGPVTLSYRILATELTVRTCHLSSDHAFLALAGVVLVIEEQRWSPHVLELLLPSDWRPFIALPRAGDDRWLARDVDQLIDSPVIPAGSRMSAVSAGSAAA